MKVTVIPIAIDSHGTVTGIGTWTRGVGNKRTNGDYQKLQHW